MEVALDGEEGGGVIILQKKSRTSKKTTQEFETGIPLST